MLAPSMYTWPPCACTICADLADRLLEDAVRRRVRDHQRAEPPLVLARPSRAGRRRRCCRGCRTRRPPRGIRPSPRSRGWCRAPRPESGRRRGAPRRGCDGTRGSRAGPRTRPASPAFGCSETAAKPVISPSHARQLRSSARIALRLRGRRERVQAADPRPRDRQHLGGGVQLHRARAERDHRRASATGRAPRASACSAASRARSDAC